MNPQDLIITPIYLTVFYLLAITYCGKYVRRDLRHYFFFGLTFKFFGAFLVGLIYQFYYEGGDTFNYWHHGSRWIWEAFIDNPINGLKMIFGNAAAPEHFQYYQKIWLRRSSDTFFIVKVTAFFDLFTFHTYSATALFFAMTGFVGSWHFFSIINRLFPGLTFGLFVSVFAIPSVVMWGAGIMKDSLTLSALFIAFSQVIRWVVLKRKDMTTIVLFLLSCWVLYVVKIYILMCFIPVMFVFIYSDQVKRIRSKFTKALLAPVLATIILGAAYLITNFVSAGNERYAIDKIPEWTMITAHDLGYWTGRNAGSGYTLGTLDGTWYNMLSKIIPAINVTLFRPYPWEVSNILMAVTSLESVLLLVFFGYLLLFKSKFLPKVFDNPIITSILVFSLVFAFAVGISTYNFGTLSRYKIPALPFFSIFLVYWYSLSRNRKVQKGS